MKSIYIELEEREHDRKQKKKINTGVSTEASKKMPILTHYILPFLQITYYLIQTSQHTRSNKE